MLVSIVLETSWKFGRIRRLLTVRELHIFVLDNQSPNAEINYADGTLNKFGN